MKTTENYQGNKLRESTSSKCTIFYEGKELKTSKSGAINSSGGIVLKATLPDGSIVKWRSNNNYGKKGFSYDDMNNINYVYQPNHKAEDDSKINRILPELRSKLEYKIS